VHYRGFHRSAKGQLAKDMEGGEKGRFGASRRKKECGTKGNGYIKVRNSGGGKTLFFPKGETWAGGGGEGRIPFHFALSFAEKSSSGYQRRKKEANCFSLQNPQREHEYPCEGDRFSRLRKGTRGGHHISGYTGATEKKESRLSGLGGGSSFYKGKGQLERREEEGGGRTVFLEFAKKPFFYLIERTTLMKERLRGRRTWGRGRGQDSTRVSGKKEVFS